MKIIFKKVRWKNLLSTGNNFIEIDLFSHPTTLISGKNGSGKSTFMDALCFGLYNRSFRGVNKSDLVNETNGKLLVEIEFEIGKNKYLVRRGANPNIFEIYKNKKKLDQDSESKQQQEILENTILRRSFKTFCQIDILGSANFTPFMQLNSSEKRVFVEDILDLQVFSNMNTVLKDKNSKNFQELERSKDDIVLLASKIEFYKEQREKAKKYNQDAILEKENKINDLISENQRLQEELKEKDELIKTLQAKIEKKAALEKAKNNLQNLITQEKNKIKTIEETIKFYEENPKCPQCEQDIEHKFKHDIIIQKQNEIEKIKDSSDKTKEKIKAATKKLEEFEIVANQITELNQQLNEIKTGFNSNTRLIKEYEQNIKKLKTDLEKVDSGDDVLMKLDKDLIQLNHTKNKLLKVSDLYETASNLLKDSGIKTEIIKDYIPLLNNLINKYLEQMGFQCLFELDENFKVKVKQFNRFDMSYDSFSEGEKMRINLAILFAWREICKLRNSSATNLLILDEVMDSSLDASGMEEFLKIVIDLSKTNNIFIISHKDQISDKFSKNIRFIKEKNFSKIIEG